MPAVKLEAFQGIVPKAAKTVLAPTQGQQADNVRLYGGDLYPWRKPKFTFQPKNTNPIVSIYHVVHSSTSDDRWLTFEQDTDVVEGPVPDVAENRLYMTQANSPPSKTNWAMLSTGAGPYPATTVPMGVPNPTGTLGLSASGTGTGTAVTRAYVYTWVNAFGSVSEETAPSNAAAVNWQTGQTITVTRTETPPAAPQNITKWRIYRTVTSSAGTASFLMVAELPIATTTFTDNISDAAIPGDPLNTVNFDPPPANLQGLVSMPNGILAGFVGNEVYFSEPYMPHAWPADYVQPVAYAIVGLAVYEQNLVVMTKGSPYVMTGITPDVMSVTAVKLFEPCVAKRSIAADMSGVCYASPNGLVGISSLVQGVVSSGLMRRQEWQKYNPTLFTSIVYNGQYFGFAPDTQGTSSSGGWGMILDKSDSSQLAASTKTDVASYANAPPMSQMDYWANAAFVDRTTANLYVVDYHSNYIYQIDGDELDYMIGEWMSKRFILTSPANMSCIQVDADYEASDEPLYELVQRYVTDNTNWLSSNPTSAIHGGVNCMQMNGGGNRTAIGNTMGTVNGSPEIWDMPNVFDFRSCNIQVFAQDVLVYTYNPVSIEPVRMLSGFKAHAWEIKSSANFRVRSISMATSMTELKQV